MKYTHEELNKRCEKYFEELIEKGIDADEIQDLCVIFLENGGRKYIPKLYLKGMQTESGEYLLPKSIVFLVIGGVSITSKLVTLLKNSPIGCLLSPSWGKASTFFKDEYLLSTYL